MLSAGKVAFEGRGEMIFEGLTMLLAAGVLTWMIFWMQRQGRQMRTGLEVDVHHAAITSNAKALFGLAFVAVVREGIETVLFLTAASFRTTAANTLFGGLLGLIAAVTLAWLMFVAGKRMNVRSFFQASSILLILFAAGLVAQGVHELQEATLLPVIVAHVWDINPFFDERGTLGGLLKALFGYNGNPSLLEVVVYAGYFMLLVVWSLQMRQLAFKTQMKGGD